MTKILVFSDSHGRRSGITAAIKSHPDASMALFLGDGLEDFAKATDGTDLKTVRVRGNCDFFLSDKSVRDVEALSVENVSIMMTHGHLFGVKSDIGTALDKAAEAGVDIFLYGHTHEPFNHTFRVGERHIRMFNPGSIGNGRACGNTYGVIVIDGTKVVASHGVFKDN
jgi:hypothetical protein